MTEFQPNPPKPFPPNVAIVNPDGTPTMQYYLFQTKLYEFLAHPGQASDFTPTTATIAAAGAVNRTIATMIIPGTAIAPITWSIGQNPGAIGVKMTGNLLQSSSNPIGTVGDHFVQVSAVDAGGTSFSGWIKITLT